MPFSQRFGTAGLYAFALGGFLGTTLESVGLFFMVCAFALNPPLGARQLVREPMALLLGAFLLYLTLRTAWAVQEFPGTAAQQIDLAFTWAGLWLFVFVARWLDPAEIPKVAAVALAGLLLGAAKMQDWSELPRLLEGTRAGFGFGIPQAGLFSALAIIGLVCFAPRVLRRHGGRWKGLARLALWATVLAVAIEMLLITQSRISWFAAAIVGSATAFLTVRRVVRGGHRVSAGWRWLVLAAAGGAVVAILVANREVIELRYEQYLKSTDALSRTDGQVADDPIELRVELARHGMRQWLERPWLGWGPGTRVALSASTLPHPIAHLHNSYLELVARLGLVGALLYGAALWLIARSVWKAVRSGRLAVDSFLFLVGAVAVVAIWATANFRPTSEVRFALVLLGAMAYSTAWLAGQASGPSGASSRSGS